MVISSSVRILRQALYCSCSARLRTKSPWEERVVSVGYEEIPSLSSLPSRTADSDGGEKAPCPSKCGGEREGLLFDSN